VGRPGRDGRGDWLVAIRRPGTYPSPAPRETAARSARIPRTRTDHTAMHPSRLLRVALLVLALSPVGAGPAAAQEPVRLSVAEFGELRWLAGDWRGEGAGGMPFFEGYRFADDSTLVMTYFADSTVTRVTGTATVELRAGQVQHRSGGARWVVTELDGSGVHFSPVVGATNAFVWKRESASRWTASLSYPDRPAVVYRMRRYPDGGS
jgi:hypothetical protein